MRNSRRRSPARRGRYADQRPQSLGIPRLRFGGDRPAHRARARTRAHQGQGSRVGSAAGGAADRRLHRHRAHALGDARRAEHRQRAPASPRATPLPWSTTASSKTTRSCAKNCAASASSSRRRPTPRSSPTWSSTTRIRAPTCSTRCAATIARLRGAYAIAVLSKRDPGRVIGARRGSPLVVGLADGEQFIASDVHALLPVTRRFIYLAEGDVVDATIDGVTDLRRERRAGRASGEGSALRRRRGRARRVSPLHAQGDPRAAAGDRRHARRAHQRRPHPARDLRHRRARPAGENAQRAHRRLRHQLPRRRWSRATGSRAWPAFRATSRSPRSTATATPVVPRRHAVRHHVAVRRDRRHAGGTAPGQAARLSASARHLQRAGIIDRARIGTGADDPRRSGNRRRLDQGLHDPA